MRVSDAGINLIKRFEGLRLTAYFCAAGVPTIGYGHTRTVTRQDVEQGRSITAAEAEHLLREDLRVFEEGVARALGGVPCRQHEFDAFVSLAYNIGVAAFAKSTACRLHRAGDCAGAASAILLWNRAGGRVLPGLVRRREAERELYLGAAARRPAPTPKLKPVLARPAPRPVEPKQQPRPSIITRVRSLFGGGR